jgi:hypothetical protein
MTMWYGGNGWSWCSLFGHSPATVILWGVIFVAAAFAFGLALRQRSDHPASTGTGAGRRQREDDDFYRRLM